MDGASDGTAGAGRAAGGAARAAWRARYGPWALVTGASDGIGRAIAIEAAARGLDVMLVARRADRLATLAGDLSRRYGVEAAVQAADLADPEAVRAMLATAGEREIGLFAACAGFGTAGPFLDIDAADELAMLDVNCRAVLAMARPLAARMAARGRGGLVLMSSIVAFQGARHAATYAATKAFVQTLAEGLRADLAARGVDVLAAAPGPVASGFGARAGMDLGRAERPEVVARGTLDALGRRGTVRPGLLAKGLWAALAPLPRPVRTAIMGRIMAGMTASRHHAAP